MNTPAHLLLGASAFGRAEKRGTFAAAIAGAMVPDLSLYLLVAWHLLIVETPARIVFDELYFSDGWQRIFAIDNSLILWGAALAVALWRNWAVGIAFAAAGLLHIALDLPLHAGDGRPHFWPVTMWVYDSPLSYWDSRFGAGIVGPIEMILAAVAAVVIWRRFASWAVRGGVALLLLAQAATTNIWAFVF